MNIFIKRKHILARLLLISFLLALFIPATSVFAYSGDNTMPDSRLLPRLLDYADLFSPSEEADLMAKLDDISTRHSSNVVILTVDSHYGSIQDYADDFFDYNGFQADYNGSGVMFMLSMADREWAITTCGTAINVFTDYGQEELFDKMRPYLADDEYYEAFNKYIEVAERYYTLYEEGTPYDVDYKDLSPGAVRHAAFICVIIGLLGALVPMFFMSLELITVEKKDTAAGYQSHNGIKLDVHTDKFVRTSMSKTRKSESSSSGGSSTHTSSSGSSHGGSSGHF